MSEEPNDKDYLSWQLRSDRETNVNSPYYVSLTDRARGVGSDNSPREPIGYRDRDSDTSYAGGRSGGWAGLFIFGWLLMASTIVVPSAVGMYYQWQFNDPRELYVGGATFFGGLASTVIGYIKSR